MAGITSAALASNDPAGSTTGIGTSTIATTQTAATTTEPSQAALLKQVNRGIVKYRRETWHWQHLTGRTRTRSHYHASAVNSLPYAQAVLKLWHGRALRWRAVARRWMRQRIQEYRRTVEHWRLVMGQTAHGRTLAAGGSLEEQFQRWRTTKQHLHREYSSPPLLSDWLCIHSYEGSWTDPGSPYWGGLQMDLSFQETYGGWLLKHKGTADHWTPLEQIWTALKAYRSRGFSPWPNTARACGLPT